MGYAKNSITPEFEGSTVGGRLHVCPRGDAVADLPGSIGIGLPPRLFARLCAPRIARSAQVLFECIACGGGMACEVVELGEFVCAVLGAISPFKAQVLQWWDMLAAALTELIKFILLHSHFITGLFGFAMFVWRKWERREAYIFARLAELLRDQGQQVRRSSEHALQVIEFPSPRPMPSPPMFAEKALKKVFERDKWQSVLSPVNPLTAVDRKLQKAHELLDKKHRLAEDYQSFVNHQRYAAFMLEGAIASARASKVTTNVEVRQAYANTALDKFEAALKVDGREVDIDALELKIIQLRNLGNNAGADLELTSLKELAERQIDDEGSFISTRSVLRLARTCRYQMEIDHLDNANGSANTHGLNALANHRLAAFFDRRIELSEQLERAHFHEIHGCVRANLPNAATDGVAEQSLAKCEKDYLDVIKRINVQRSSRWWRKFNDAELRINGLAVDGLKRAANARRCFEGQICPHHHSPDIIRTTTPAQ
jgi:hypothetical protein